MALVNLNKEKKIQLLAISIGIVYLWFGMLKFIPGASPAENLATDTITRLFVGIIPPNISIVLLAIWEVLVGVFLIINFQRKWTVALALAHMVLTFSVFFLLPEQSFKDPPFILTIIGQYVIKNLVIICGLIVLLPGKTDSTSG